MENDDKPWYLEEGFLIYVGTIVCLLIFICLTR